MYLGSISGVHYHLRFQASESALKLKTKSCYGLWLIEADGNPLGGSLKKR